jgi:hypothetical protein
VPEAVKTRLSIHFHPHNFVSRGHAVEKDDGSGHKRKYLIGASSGPRWDAHGERMTERCVKGFMEQANKGDVLLYPDLHGIRFSEDFGILNKAEVAANGDWITEYRLYDELDQVDQRAVELAAKTWKQINGLPPYRYPRQRGFSVEGDVKEEDILQVNRGGQRVMDWVTLDGVILTPRPAYTDSVAVAVYKALGEAPQADQGTIYGRMQERLADKELEDSFFRRRYQIADALDEIIREVMQTEGGDRAMQLKAAYDEYRDLMVPLILEAPSTMFEAPENGPRVAAALTARPGGQDALHIVKAIRKSMTGLIQRYEGAAYATR